MAPAAPPFPRGCPRRFRSTVHGTIFAGRDRHFDGMDAGDRLLLVPDPPGQTDPEVWVHLESGDPVGHLPPEISAWLWSWLRGGGMAFAVAVAVHGADTPSWRRLLLEVRCDCCGGRRGRSGPPSAPGRDGPSRAGRGGERV